MTDWLPEPLLIIRVNGHIVLWIGYIRGEAEGNKPRHEV